MKRDPSSASGVQFSSDVAQYRIETVKAPRQSNPGRANRQSQLHDPGKSETWRQSKATWRPTTTSFAERDTESVLNRPSHIKTLERRLNSVRNVLTHSQWYYSPVAVRIRLLMENAYFITFMSLCLFFALFLQDLWVIWGINDNTVIDSVLTLIMFAFAAELVMLSAVEASYLLSFFFFMDILGTLSMIADITYLKGASNTEEQTSEGSDGATSNLLLLRASRAARVGARVGRMSRVVRIIRFLPFLMHARSPEERRGIAKHISNQLTSLLSTRVAGLTMILVMVIPLFDVLTFPQTDYSQDTWVVRLTEDLKGNQAHIFALDIDYMVEFFSRHNYGPFHICEGVKVGNGHFDCVTEVTSWQPKVSKPPRGASVLSVRSDTLKVDFNMHRPEQIQAAMQIVNICLITVIMVVSGLALSSVVGELAVQPLERMLNTVQRIATTVFKLSAEVIDDEEEESKKNIRDIENSSELKLLEKVVAKLAIVAQLQTKSYQTEHNLEHMRDEDIAILDLIQGKTAGTDSVEESTNKIRVSSASKKAAMQNIMHIEEIGISQDSYQSWSFQVMNLTKDQMCKLGTFIIDSFLEASDTFEGSLQEEQRVARFVDTCSNLYPDNPFHNFSHAADVIVSVSRMQRLLNATIIISELEQYALLIAAIGHDLGHPGYNNGFLSEVGHELALRYNDRSPLENMHCAKLYSVVAKQETNILTNLDRVAYAHMRRLCIETILHTDMMSHGGMVKDLQTLFQMNSAIFTADTLSLDRRECNTNAEREVLLTPSNKQLMLNNMLHSADVSNPCRAWEVSQAWAWCVLEEFFQQGDKEKELGIPVQFLNDRDKLNRPNSQIGFIEFMIAPFFAAQIRLWPALCPYGDNLANNIGGWDERWCREVCPKEEEKAKVKARVQKVKDNLDDAKWRGCPPARLGKE